MQVMIDCNVTITEIFSPQMSVGESNLIILLSLVQLRLATHCIYHRRDACHVHLYTHVSFPWLEVLMMPAEGFMYLLQRGSF